MQRVKNNGTADAASLAQFGNRPFWAYRAELGVTSWACTAAPSVIIANIVVFLRKRVVLAIVAIKAEKFSRVKSI